jgi:hypothetical protein
MPCPVLLIQLTIICGSMPEMTGFDYDRNQTIARYTIAKYIGEFL